MNLKTLKRYVKIWTRLTALQFQEQVANARAAAIILLAGKALRFITAFIFLWAIVGQAKVLAGYNLAEAVFVLALFNWGTSFTELFLRGVYQFKQKVEDGTFDFYLLSPVSELFYSLFSYTDALDALMMIPYTIVLFWSWGATGYPVTGPGLLWVFAAIVAMCLFVLSLHIVVLGVGVKYIEVDNTIMLYRDVERMAAFPIDIYTKVVGFGLTYVMPFAVIATVPAKIIFGRLSPAILLFFLALTFIEYRLALAFWHRSLRSYTSASS